MPTPSLVSAFPKGAMQDGFRDGGRRISPDAGPDPTDGAAHAQVFRAPGVLLPVKKLMAAILQDVIDDLRRYPRAERGRHERYREAERWCREDRPDWPFSFVSICHALGFDVDAVRDRLLHVDPPARATAAARSPRAAAPSPVPATVAEA